MVEKDICLFSYNQTLEGVQKTLIFALFGPFLGKFSAIFRFGGGGTLLPPTSAKGFFGKMIFR